MAGRRRAPPRLRNPLERPQRRVAIEMALDSVRIALGDDASDAEVERVHQGLLFLMGYESELRASIPRGRARRPRRRSSPSPSRFSMHRPVVVVLSDLHWADDLVLELVDTLLERLASRRFVVLATARQVIEERWHPPHGRHNLVVLTLDPLTAESAAALLRELAGAELGDELRRGAARPQRRQPLLPGGARHPAGRRRHGRRRRRRPRASRRPRGAARHPARARGGPARRPHRRGATRARRLCGARSAWRLQAIEVMSSKHRGHGGRAAHPARPSRRRSS